ncbi:restriction endonuclease subunit S [Enorma massiliensis]|uniref:restriction endonuclease subunit S n=1 Tax=Enorma massiliensis TaxID=1472761 RepID=UPI0034A25E10
MTNKPPFAGEKVRLGDLGKTICGGTPSSKHPEFFAGSIPWIGTTALNGGKLDKADAVKLITREAVEKSATKIIPPNSIMVGIRVGVGKVAINSVPMCTSQDIVSVVSIDEAEWCKEYISMVLQYKAPVLAAQAQGATITGISSKTLKSITIPVAPLETQRRIVEELRAIEAQKVAANSILKSFSALVKSRFVEMFGDPAASPKFETCRVEDIADVFVGVVVKPKQYYADDSKNAVKAFRSLNVGEMHIRDNDWVYFTQEGNQAASKSILKSGDILIVRSGYPGTSCVVSSEYEGCNAIDLIIARIKDDGVLPEFLAAFNNSTRMKDLIERMSVGSAQKHFNVGFYKQVEIPLPPIEIQREYLAFQHRVDKSRVVVQKQIERLQTLYDSLAQEYFG